MSHGTETHPGKPRRDRRVRIAGDHCGVSWTWVARLQAWSPCQATRRAVDWLDLQELSGASEPLSATTSCCRQALSIRSACRSICTARYLNLQLGFELLHTSRSCFSGCLDLSLSTTRHVCCLPFHYSLNPPPFLWGPGRPSLQNGCGNRKQVSRFRHFYLRRLLCDSHSSVDSVRTLRCPPCLPPLPSTSSIHASPS